MRRRDERGSALIMAMGVMITVLTVGTGLLRLATQEYKSTGRIGKEAQALGLAEAGVEWGLNQLNGDASFTGTASAVSMGAGSFTCSVGASGSDKTITGVGTVAGVTKSVRVVLKVATAAVSFPEGALVANGTITLSGSPHTITVPNTTHVASMRANGDINYGGNPTTDGPVASHGTVVHPNWMTSGGYNFPYGFTNGAPAITFPNAAGKDAQAAAWKAMALSGPTTAPPVNQGWNYFDGQWHNWTGTNLFYPSLSGPRYISGTVNLSNSTIVYFDGPPGSIVYIDGDMIFGGNTNIYSSCIVVVSGRIQMGNTCNYHLLAPATPAQVAVVSLAKSETAISMAGAANNENRGVFWAMNGGITVAAGAQFQGSLVAGGNPSSDPTATAPFVNGNIVASGNAEFKYPAGQNLTNTVINTAASYTIDSYQQL
jgi:Tfp pilus assembly protein PilX